MHIVILDGYTLNPGDLYWGALNEFGKVNVYERTPANLTVRRAKNAEILFTNKTVLDAKILSKLSKCKYIGVLATGYNVVDLQAASDAEIVVTNIPAYGSPSVAQMVFAHILNITQRVAQHDKTVAKDWSAAPDFCYWNFPLIELKGKTLGIVGFGKIGREVAKLGSAFGMKIIYTRRRKGRTSKIGRQVDLKTLFKSSDIVSLHCPLTDENLHFVDEKLISKMKPTAILINTARGGLVDEEALYNALKTGKISAAGLDVLNEEPPNQGNPLFKLKNCFITPHIAWATKAARQRLMNIAVNNLRQFLNGRPVNVVNN